MEIKKLSKTSSICLFLYSDITVNLNMYYISGSRINILLSKRNMWLFSNHWRLPHLFPSIELQQTSPQCSYRSRKIFQFKYSSSTQTTTDSINSSIRWWSIRGGTRKWKEQYHFRAQCSRIPSSRPKGRAKPHKLQFSIFKIGQRWHRI